MYSSVTRRYFNKASSKNSYITGGLQKMASWYVSSVTKHDGNKSSGIYSSITKGKHNEAPGLFSSITGSYENKAFNG